MSEAIYVQVEHAIQRHLHVRGRYRRQTDSPSYEVPVAIREGNIILQDGDCGSCKPERIITTDEWAALVESGGLHRRVGVWDFVLADDPAADDTAFCHHSPRAAGWAMYRLREERDEALTALRLIRRECALLMESVGWKHDHELSEWAGPRVSAIDDAAAAVLTGHGDAS